VARARARAVRVRTGRRTPTYLQPPRKGPLQPGFPGSLLLHVPIGIQYLNALRDQAPIDHADWRKARLYMIAFAASSVAAPNFLLRDNNSPYKFTAKQVARHTAPTHD
jgi:hypothetical protein